MRYAGEPRVDMMHERRNVFITSTYGWTQEETVDTTTIPCAAKGIYLLSFYIAHFP